MRLENRVQKLEADRNGGGVTVIVWQNLTETEDEALERWKQEHPGQEVEELQIYLASWAHPDDAPWGQQ